VLCRVSKPREDVFSMAALAEDVVDMFEVLEVALRKSLLIGNEEILAGGAKPAGEDTLEEDVSVELLFDGEYSPQRGDASAVGDGDIISCIFQTLAHKIYIAVQANAVSAGDDVDTFYHR
jgi:hypothetical protein